MTEFSKVFSQNFRLKRKYVYQAMLFELIGTFLLSIVSLWQGYDKYNAINIPLTASFGAFFMVNLYFLVVMVRRTNQMLTSQTWRLVPVSGTILFLSSILTSIISFLYLWFLQVLFSAILAIPMLIRATQTNKYFWPRLSASLDYQQTLSYLDWPLFFQFILVLFLIAVLTFCVTIFVKLAGQVIADFLPATRGKTAQIFVYFVLIFVIISVFRMVGNGFSMLYQSTLMASNSEANMWVIIGFLLLGNLVFSLIDVWLLDHYAEAQQ